MQELTKAPSSRRHTLWLALALATLLAPSAGAADEIRLRGTVDFRPAAGEVAADLNLEVPADDPPDILSFFLNAGLEITALEGDGLLGFERSPLPGHETWSRLALEFRPAPDRSTHTLRIAYEGVPLMPSNGINSISGDWIELSVDSAWHPVLTSLIHPMRVDLTLELPEGWEVVTSGDVSPTETGTRIVSRFPQIDVAFVASPRWQTHGSRALRVFHRGLDETELLHLVDRATACRDWLDRRFGPDPVLPPLRFVVTGRDEGGYARGNYIVLTDISGRDTISLTEFLCHELGHYWSRGAPPGTVENWLNEGFAVFIAARAIRALHGEDAFDALVAGWNAGAAGAGPIWTPEATARRSHAVNYKKAPLFLLRLQRHLGEDAFESLLTRYARQPIDSTRQLLEAIEEIGGAESRQWAVGALAETSPEVQ